MENGQRALIKREETMQILGIGLSKFYQLTKLPDFPSLRIGRYVYVDRNRLDDWIAKQIAEPDKGRSETTRKDMSH